ncbi:MAG: ribonuclease Z [Bacteroidia bacterium]
MFEITILGSSAAIPVGKRRPTAQVVTYHNRHYLVDCGEGTQMQLGRYRVKLARLDAIFISHMHGDHVLGLPGLLNTLSLLGRNFPLKLYGPAALKPMLDNIFETTQGHLAYKIEFTATDDFAPGEAIMDTGRLQVQVLPLEHRIYCRGYRFQEVNVRPKFNFPKAKSLEIPNVYFGSLKRGLSVTLEDGRVIDPDTVLSPPDNPVSYAYCSDTRYSEALIPYIKNATLLYHESTFDKSMGKRAIETFHSTAEQAASIAKQAEVNHLLIGHFSARYRSLEPLLEEAQEVFPDTSLAVEGDLFKVKDYV